MGKKDKQVQKEIDRDVLQQWDPTIDFGDPSLLEKLINWFFVVLLGAVMIYYTILIIQNYLADQADPPTSVIYSNPTPGLPVDYPTITVCNLNANVPLDIWSCNHYERAPWNPPNNYSVEDCIDTVYFRHDLLSDDPLSNQSCWVINARIDKSISTKFSGFYNSLDLEFDTHYERVEDGYVAGLFVYLHEWSEDSIHPNFTEISNTDTIINTGIGTVISMGKVITNYYKQERTVDFGTTVSQLAVKSENSSYVYLTFNFKRLSVEEITQTPSYQLASFFGDFAGMLGTLVGVDCLKVIIRLISLPKFIAAYKRRRIIKYKFRRGSITSKGEGEINRKTTTSCDDNDIEMNTNGDSTSNGDTHPNVELRQSEDFSNIKFKP